MPYLSYKDALIAPLSSRKQNQHNNSVTDNGTSSRESFITASQDIEEQGTRNFETSSRTSVDPSMQDTEEKDTRSLDETSPLFAQSRPCYDTPTEDTQTPRDIRFRAPVLRRSSEGLNEEDSDTQAALYTTRKISCFEAPRYIRFRTLPQHDSPPETSNRQNTEDDKNWSFSQSKPCFEFEPKVPTAFLRANIGPVELDTPHGRHRWDTLLKAPVSKQPLPGRVSKFIKNFLDTANLQVSVPTGLSGCQCSGSPWEALFERGKKGAVDAASITITESSESSVWSVVVREFDSNRLAQVSDKTSEASMSTTMHQRPQRPQSTGMVKSLGHVRQKDRDTMLQIDSGSAMEDSTKQAASALPSIIQADLGIMLSPQSETVDKNLKGKACNGKVSTYGNDIHEFLWEPVECIRPNEVMAYLALTGGPGGDLASDSNFSYSNGRIQEWLTAQEAAGHLENQYEGPSKAQLVNGRGDVLAKDPKLVPSDGSSENFRGVTSISPGMGAGSDNEALQENEPSLRRLWRRCKEKWKKVCPMARFQKWKKARKDA